MMTLPTTKIERSALIVATVTSFMGPFMISSVNVALPAIQKEFLADAVILSWIATSYLLATAVFLVPMGRLADIHGRKRIFIGGLIAFTVTTFLTVFVRSVMQLILLRILQGAGAAMMVTTGMAILTSVFPPNRRGRAIGIYVSAVYIGLSLGPFVGGILTQHFGWRSIFYLVTPIGLFSIFVTLAFLKGEWADAKGEAFDFVGSVLYGISLVLIVYGSTRLPSLLAVSLIFVGVIGLIAFIRHELRNRAPVFEVRLFTNNKLFAFSSFAALINYAATFAVTFLLSLYLQYIKGLPPQIAGTLLVVQPVCMALFSPFSGKLSDRIEPRRIASAGMALTTLGLVLLIGLSPDTSRFYVVMALFTLGVGFALFSSPNMNAIMGAVEKRYYGIASGTVATMRLLGQMMSMAVATIVFAILIGEQQIVPETFGAFLFSVKISFTIFAAVCFMGIFFSLFRGDLRR
jgi:EmrB/QacA subfamily drug resistance transporter